jgi:hypothetical protein
MDPLPCLCLQQARLQHHVILCSQQRTQMLHSLRMHTDSPFFAALVALGLVVFAYFKLSA